MPKLDPTMSNESRLDSANRGTSKNVTQWSKVFVTVYGLISQTGMWGSMLAIPFFKVLLKSAGNLESFKEVISMADPPECSSRYPEKACLKVLNTWWKNQHLPSNVVFGTSLKPCTNTMNNMRNPNFLITDFNDRMTHACCAAWRSSREWLEGEIISEMWLNIAKNLFYFKHVVGTFGSANK